MDSSSNLNNSALFSHQEYGNKIHMHDDDGQEEESSNWNMNQPRLHLSTSFLTSAVDMNVTSLPLIHQDPKGWHFVSANLRKMAAGRGNLDVVLYLIETFLEEFSPGFNADILKRYFESLKNADKDVHKDIFCQLAKLILRTPELFSNTINLLVPNEFEKVSLSKTQCLCLIAHMFMCISLAPQQNRVVHFGYIFHQVPNSDKLAENVQIEKIKCLVNYFAQALKEEGERTIVFERIAAEGIKDSEHGKYYKIGNEDCSLDAWKSCTDKLRGFSYEEGGIKGGPTTIEIAFSGLTFGGHTLLFAAIQQEIIILRSPECLPGFLLFQGQMNDGEAFCIAGARYFNQCIGYGSTFQWKCPYKEDASEFSKKKTVFIDAYNFKRQGASMLQFSDEKIQRELTKAFIGFLPHVNDGRNVSTGGWGSGLFRGNIYLKFLLQWIAASRAKRKMEFYAFGNKMSSDLIEKVKKRYEGKEIKDLMADILICAKNAPKENNKDYDFLAAMNKEFNWK